MPQTVYDVGDPITSRLKLGVTPDGSTARAVTVKRPDGTTIAASPGSFVGDEVTVQFYATDDGTAGGTADAASGDWLVVWKVTGTGASVTPKIYNVVPLPGTSTRPAWSPFLSDVADHVPFLTQDESTPGSQVWLGTFTGYTSPTDEQAQRHIDAAVRMVGAGLGTLTGSLSPMARTVAALRAAATLCRAFARSSDDRARADGLDRQFALDLKALQSAADDAGTTPASVGPVMYAPAPVAWGDRLLVDGSDPVASTREFLWPE
jgi:hypothetical protein